MELEGGLNSSQLMRGGIQIQIHQYKIGGRVEQLMREDSFCSHMIEDITGRRLPYEVKWKLFW